MPDDIEEIFAAQSLPLFPATAAELSMDCTCPDWEVSCKHIAAVFYLLAEAFDEDPFTILAWRGRERDHLLANLRSVRSAGPPAADSVEAAGQPLADCLDYFCLQGGLPVTAPSSSPATAVLDQLPDIEVTLRGRTLPELLRPAYEALPTEAVE